MDSFYLTPSFQESSENLASEPHKSFFNFSKKDPDKKDHSGMLEDLEFKDDGFLGLVLKVIAAMCNGQHKPLQVAIELLEIILSLKFKSRSITGIVTSTETLKKYQFFHLCFLL